MRNKLPSIIATLNGLATSLDLDSESMMTFTGTGTAGYTDSWSASSGDTKSGFLSEDTTPPNSFAAEVVIKTGSWLEPYAGQTVKFIFDAAAFGSDTVYGYVDEDSEGSYNKGGMLYELDGPGVAQGELEWQFTLPTTMSGVEIWFKVVSTSQEWVSVRNFRMVVV